MPFPPTPSITPSNTPTSSITPSNTPTITPTQSTCPSGTPTQTPTMTPTPTNLPCLCTLLISDELFTIDYIDCFGEFQNSIANETFPGQWTLQQCLKTYTITSGTVDTITQSTECFLSEGQWYCPG